MKTQSVHGKLGRFKNVSTKRGLAYYSRTKPQVGDRYVEVIDQNGLAVCLPIIVEADGTERVVFSAKTIKSLVDFLEGF